MRYEAVGILCIQIDDVRLYRRPLGEIVEDVPSSPATVLCIHTMAGWYRVGVTGTNDVDMGDAGRKTVLRLVFVAERETEKTAEECGLRW